MTQSFPLPDSRSRNILVIAPHADDEVCGCGGMIAKRTSQGHFVHVVVAAVGGLKHRHLDQAATTEQRKSELAAAAGILGVQRTTILHEGLDMRMDTVAQLELVSAIDGLLDELPYDEVYFPYAGHNADHRAVYNAAFSALRIVARRRAPALAAMYEYTFVGWSPQHIEGGKLYVDITDTLATKLTAMHAYQSQMRPGIHNPLSDESLTALARFRGVESELQYAELFYIQRLITQ